MSERWRDVPGYRGLYQVSDLGRVASVPRVVCCKNGRKHTLQYRVLKPWRCSKEDYLAVALWRGRQRKVYRLARLVLLAFRGPPKDPAMQASHEPNPDPRDNRLCNLQWRTHLENMEERDERARSEREVDDVYFRELEEGIDPVLSEVEDSSVPF